MSDTPEEKRRRRLQTLAGWIQGDGESSRKAMVGKCMLAWGSKRETVERYLEDLEWAGLIDVAGDEITWVGGGDHE
ncbi:MAG: hypothetical protein LN413_06935 [Candidatus Thermoplasmatota archaeon]|nr:hypothetical protein [Candidatus Thermoplasmatota archaeon]